MKQNILPTVSIIILNYNGKELLDDCISSLQKLDYPKQLIEIILVDNDSKDDSIEFVSKHYSEVKIIKNSKNFGFAKGNNIGIKAARGEYIALLNNDMRVNKEWLFALIKPMITDKSIGITTSKILNWDGTKIDFAGSIMSFCGFGYQRGYGNKIENYNEPELCLFPCGGGMAASKSLFLKLGGFDEDFFAYYEDVDLGWRTWIYGYSILYVPSSLVYHKQSQTKGKANVKHVYLLEKNALNTIFKNYELKNLIPIFFSSILLLLYRMKIDKKKGDLYSLKERRSAFLDFTKHFIINILKRIIVQKHRRKKDLQIFPYFKVPLCEKIIWYTDEEKNILYFNKIVRIFKIDKIFKPNPK